MNRKKRLKKLIKESKDSSLFTKLDANFYNRLPDHHFTRFDLPGVISRYMRMTVREGVVETQLEAAFAEFSRPKTAIVHANRDVTIYDVYGRILVPEKYHIVSTRKRLSGSSKIKYLNVTPGLSPRLNINPGHIFECCDYVISIDTNTKVLEKINGDIVSVLGISTSKLSSLSFPRLVYINSRNAIEFRNLKEPREKIGWVFAIRQMFLHRLIDPNSKICIIVDSFQNEIMDYNNGKNLFSDTELLEYFLPSNVKLAYASSDTNQENSLNKCIHEADSLADFVRDKIKHNESLHIMKKMNREAPFDSVRLWSISDDGLSMEGIVPDEKTLD